MHFNTNLCSKDSQRVPSRSDILYCNVQSIDKSLAAAHVLRNAKGRYGSANYIFYFLSVRHRQPRGRVEKRGRRQINR